ncbi:hypothetical protein E3J20_01600 [Candidatus Bathyarchaeota archaeon]|nr:MAG: hypothetical protein E3J20_01600 [Candidatus Bathyarchaeota archaeon]
MSEKLTINAEILLQLIERGSADATLQAVRDVNTQVTQNITVYKEASGSARKYGTSMRRLSMNLRMMSIGLRILRNEFGGINPVIDIGIDTLYRASAAGSVLVASYGILSTGLKTIKEAAGGTTTTLEALKIGLFTVAGGVYIVIAALEVLAGLMYAQYVFEFKAGITDLKQEIKGLEEGLKDLQGEMRNLGVEQGALTAQGAALSARIRATKLEIERSGDPTGMLTSSLESLQATLEDVGVAEGFLRAEGALTRSEILKDKDAIEDKKEMIEEGVKAAKEALGGSLTPSGVPSAPYVPAVGRKQLGGEVRRGGVVGVEAGEVIMQREQVAMMMAGGGAGQISISISLAGANISGVRDLEGTLRRGGEAAREEIRRLELQRRRGRSRY